MASQTSPPAPAQSGYASIQALRGMAAWLVVCLHVGEALQLRTGAWHLPQFARGGYVGVDIFFCLSGFIMYLTAGGEFGRAGACRRFLLRRFFRIYPVYWIASGVALVAALSGWRLFDSHLDSAAHAIKSFLLLPQSTSPVLGPGWTLVHEIRFYVTFGLMLLLPVRWAFAAVSAWGVGSLAVLIFSYAGPGWLELTLAGRAANYLFHPSSLQFVLGVLAAWVVRHRGTSPWIDGAVLACGVAGTVGVVQWFEALKPDTKYWAITLFTVPSFLLVLGAALAERRWRPRFPKIAVLLGDASYSTYLTHVISLSALMALTFHGFFGSTILNYPAWVAAGIVVGVHLTGVAFYLLIERPLHNRAREWSKRLGG